MHIIYAHIIMCIYYICIYMIYVCVVIIIILCVYVCVCSFSSAGITEMSPVNKSTFLASRQQFLFIFLVASVKSSVT